MFHDENESSRGRVLPYLPNHPRRMCKPVPSRLGDHYNIITGETCRPPQYYQDRGEVAEESELRPVQ